MIGENERTANRKREKRLTWLLGTKRTFVRHEPIIFKEADEQQACVIGCCIIYGASILIYDASVVICYATCSVVARVLMILMSFKRQAREIKLIIV